MKTILYWDPRFPDRLPRRLRVDDVVASAAVRAGVAAPADPTDAGALLAGGPLDPASLTEVSLEVGFEKRTVRLLLPLSVSAIAIGVGAAAAVGAPVTSTTPTPTPPPTLSVTLSPSSGPVGTTFTVAEIVTDGMVSTRGYSLSGSPIAGAGTTITPAAAGLLICTSQADGPGGSVTKSSAGVTVTAVSTAFPMTKFASALSAVKANTADAIVLVWGDSTEAGASYGNPPSAPAAPGTDGARPYTIAAAVAGRLKSKGLKVSQDAIVGHQLQDSTTVAQYNAYNPQMQVDPATWTISTVSTLGGKMFRKANPTAGPILFTTAETCNSFDVWVANNSGSYVFLVDGVQAATYVATATNTLVKITVPCPTEGIHTLSIDTTTAATANLSMIVARSSVKRVIVINGGWRGATSADLNDKAINTTQGYKTPAALRALAPAMACLSIGINDARTNGLNTPAATFATNIAELTGYAAESGSVMLATPSDISPANKGGTGITMQGVTDAYGSLSQSGGYNLSNTIAVIGDYATLSAAGKYENDGLHLHDRPSALQIGNARADLAYAGAIAGGYVA